MQLHPGTQNYTFQCMLPAGLPTSVEHEVGHITYGVNVVLDIPMWTDTEFKEHFTVIKPINLNLDPQFRMPSAQQEMKTFYPLGCFCCCPQGTLSVDANAPVRGYTPGQTINVRIAADNESDETVSNFDVELIKAITFHGSGTHDGRHEYRTKVVDHVITSGETPGVLRRQKKVFAVNLKVPAIPPTDFSTSSIVQVKYAIRVKSSIDGCCASDIVLDLPVTIGTYPIEDIPNAPAAYPQTVITNQPTAPEKPRGLQDPNSAPVTMPLLPNNNPTLPYHSAPSLPYPPAAEPNMPSAPIAPTAPVYPSDDPPTYEDAMGVSTDGNNTNANNFKPKYPMFSRQTSYSIDSNPN